MVKRTNPIRDDGSYSPKDVRCGEEILVRTWEKVFIAFVNDTNRQVIQKVD